MTGLRVTNGAREEVVYKRDVGNGQGSGQTIANGEPYRLDLWWQAAQTLNVNKGAVRIQLAPASGTATTLGQDTSAEETGDASTRGSGGGEECGSGSLGAGEVPLPLVPGDRTTLLPSGLAAAGREAPEAVKQMVAAGNRLYGTAYLCGGGHGPSLNTLQPAYDCSSAVSYVLHAGGALGASALDSTELASYGLPGPGRYVTIYANSAHAFMMPAGCVSTPSKPPRYDTGPN